MPRGIYPRKNDKSKPVVSVTSEAIAARLKAKKEAVGSKQLIMARARKKNEVEWSTTNPNYYDEVDREIAEKELLTRRILVDRVDMIIQLLERLRGSL